MVECVFKSFSRLRKRKLTKLSWLQNKTSRHILVPLKLSFLPLVHLISLNKKDCLKSFRDLLEIECREFFILAYSPGRTS